MSTLCQNGLENKKNPVLAWCSADQRNLSSQKYSSLPIKLRTNSGDKNAKWNFANQTRHWLQMEMLLALRCISSSGNHPLTAISMSTSSASVKAIMPGIFAARILIWACWDHFGHIVEFTADLA